MTPKRFVGLLLIAIVTFTVGLTGAFGAFLLGWATAEQFTLHLERPFHPHVEAGLVLTAIAGFVTACAQYESAAWLWLVLVCSVIGFILGFAFSPIVKRMKVN